MKLDYEISSPDDRGHGFVCVHCPELSGRLDISFFLPEPTKKLAFVTLLHGVYGSHWCWLRFGKVEEHVRQLMKTNQLAPMLYIMPSDGLKGDGGGYLEPIGQLIAKDLPLLFQNALGIEMSHHYITGLSMGGYGAIHIASEYPNYFSGVSAHSAIIGLHDFKTFCKHGFPFEDSDISALTYPQHGPSLRFDCGKDDPLLKSNREFHLQLKEAHIPHIYEEREGTHDWNYWSTQIVASLNFFTTLNSSSLSL